MPLPALAPIRVQSLFPTIRVSLLAMVSVGMIVASPAWAQRRNVLPPGAFNRGAAMEMQAGVVTLHKEQVPYTITLSGRAVPVQQANIRPRVSGAIQSVDFVPGVPLKQGAPLFTIAPEDYELDVAAGRAGLQQALASQQAAEVNLKRLQGLAGVGVTETQVDNAKVALAAAQASVASARATLNRAELNLQRTHIVSPIAGVATIQTVSIGDVVTANQSSALTTITQMDPIYVDAVESSARILAIRDKVKSGAIRRAETVQSELQLEDGSEYTLPGTVISAGLVVSQDTGSATIRVQYPNPKNAILPGQYLRMRLTVGTVTAMLVPQGATSREPDGTLTALVARDGKATSVTLSTVGTYHNQWIVTHGVKDGDELIVDNLRRVRAGVAVKTIPVKISETGVVISPPATRPETSSGTPSAEGGRRRPEGK